MKKYMIFGAGNIVAECLEYYGDKVVGGFIDNDKNKQGKLYKGKKVIDLDTYKNDFSDYTIVVATKYVPTKKFLFVVMIHLASQHLGI